MAHRGPDAQHEQHFEVAGMHVQLGHRRLSILDLSAEADQPFSSAGDQSTIVFNGEIYNHHELRRELQSRGLRFRTRSDTEVLLAGIENDGPALLPRLNGMFAFAAVNRRTASLVLARDPFGIKPLYVARLADGGLAFASEIRALAKLLDSPLEVDPSSTAEFLLNGFLYEPHSGFLGIEKLPPGHAMTIDLRSMVAKKERFYDLQRAANSASTLDSLIASQLELEVEADVPVGVFFSGGIDSSVIAAGSPRSVQAFFVDYGNGAEGDAKAAMAVAAQLKLQLRSAIHRDVDVTPNAVLDEFRAVALGTEEPISDYTYAATRVISRAAREAGFKVMLSGMGGDELFGGYPRHLAARHWRMAHLLRGLVSLASAGLRRSRRWSKKVDRLAWFAQARNFAQAYTSLVGYNSAAEVTRLTGNRADVDAFFDRCAALLQPVEDQSLLRQAMHMDRTGFLAHNLTVTDRASMAESIEVRVPLLSAAIDGYAHQLPRDQLIRRGKGKLPLKHYLARFMTPDLIDRPKVGFNPPLDNRILTIGRDRCLDVLKQGPIHTCLDLAPVQIWIADHFSGRRDNTYRLWQLLYYNFWLDAHAGSR